MSTPLRAILRASLKIARTTSPSRPAWCLAGSAENRLGRTLVLIMQFHAALWVAVEGWRASPLSNETVDELLTDPAFEQNVTLLRRFRNGVYHYQPEQINEKVLAFLRDGSEHAVAWAFLLHDKFKRVVWDIAHPRDLDPTLQAEFERAIHGAIGWLPNDLPEAAPHPRRRALS